MKYTRIFLFLSPLLLFVPPMVPMQTDNVAWTMLGSFYGLLLRRFPWNLMMAGLCYVYAQQLGREAYWWGLLSFVFPFASPLVLAFVPPKFRSTAYEVNRALSGPAAAKAAEGKFEDRFPLLERRLEGKPEATRSEQNARFSPVVANFEFAAPVDPKALERITNEAHTRKFTIWTDWVNGGAVVYGAAMVQTPAVEEVTGWLKRTGVPGEKLDVAWRQPDGTLKYFEFYPV